MCRISRCVAFSFSKWEPAPLRWHELSNTHPKTIGMKDGGCEFLVSMDHQESIWDIVIAGKLSHQLRVIQADTVNSNNSCPVPRKQLVLPTFKKLTCVPVPLMAAWTDGSVRPSLCHESPGVEGADGGVILVSRQQQEQAISTVT